MNLPEASQTCWSVTALINHLCTAHVPSLYFWLSSYALSAPPPQLISPSPDGLPCDLARAGLPYFHPSVVPHLSHMTSLTVCRPVVIVLFSAGPVVMFTLRSEATEGEGGPTRVASAPRVRRGCDVGARAELWVGLTPKRRGRPGHAAR